MSRKYKDPMLQDTYNKCFAHGADDFMRRRGGSLQSAFMDGYKGIDPCFNRTKGTFTYVAQMAGKDRRKAEVNGKIQPSEVKDQRLLEVR